MFLWESLLKPGEGAAFPWESLLEPGEGGVFPWGHNKHIHVNQREGITVRTSRRTLTIYIAPRLEPVDGR